MIEEWIGRFRKWVAIQDGVEDFLDAPITHIAIVKCTSTGRFDSLWTNGLFQAQDGLYRAKPVERSVSQQSFDDLVSGWPNPGCDLPAVIRCAPQVLRFVRRIVF